MASRRLIPIMRQVEFFDGEIYHVYNRGVEKRDIFLNDWDYHRFVHCLYEFNDEQPALNARHAYKSVIERHGCSAFFPEKVKRMPLVEIMVFTLMPNHYHLMLRQRKNKGVTRFMHKLGTGYTMYFNKKHVRVGSLFQGPFKAEHLTANEHLIHLPHYIHTNPFRGLASVEDILKYRWSSFPDYAGKENFPHVTSRDFLLNIFNGEKGYLKFTAERIGNDNNSYPEIMNQIVLE